LPYQKIGLLLGLMKVRPVENTLVILDNGSRYGAEIDDAASEDGWTVHTFKQPQVAYEHLTHDVNALFIGVVDKGYLKKVPNVFGLGDFIEMAADLEHVSKATMSTDHKNYKGGAELKYLNHFERRVDLYNQAQRWLRKTAVKASDVSLVAPAA
jgi:hypothetical protein